MDASQISVMVLLHLIPSSSLTPSLLLLFSLVADGTAALVVLIEHDRNRMIIGNSGDERAVLIRGDVSIRSLSLSIHHLDCRSANNGS